MIREISAKTILQKSRLPESAYCLNPYVGCAHKCAYCYARFMRRFTGHAGEEWGSFVDVKLNAAKVLGRQLQRAKVAGSVLLGSVCDAYQPMEKRYELTRSCLEHLVERKISFSILTKSSLVTRDIDLLQKAGSRASVGISLAMLDDTIRKIFEPGACSVAGRLEALEQLRGSGIRTYVFIGPVLPLITDIRGIVDTVRGSADAIWGEALNLRCGNVASLERAYAKANLPATWQNAARDKSFRVDAAREMATACHDGSLPLVGFYQH